MAPAGSMALYINHHSAPMPIGYSTKNMEYRNQTSHSGACPWMFNARYAYRIVSATLQAIRSAGKAFEDAVVPGNVNQMSQTWMTLVKTCVVVLPSGAGMSRVAELRTSSSERVWTQRAKGSTFLNRVVLLEEILAITRKRTEDQREAKIVL